MKRISALIAILILVGTASLRADELVYHDALVRIASGCMRAQPAHSSELVSQAVMGTPLRLIEKTDGWHLVETPDGYRGYMKDNSLVLLDSVEMHHWRQTPRVMYTGHHTGRVMRHDAEGESPVTDVHSGSVLVVADSSSDSVRVVTPGGAVGYLPKHSVTPLDSLCRDTVDTDAVIQMARALTGVSYLWGGTTPAAMDCSGFSSICYLNQGIILQRDASQQARTGTWLGTDCRDYRPGDLVFFASASTGNIIHVGIYIGSGCYINSAGWVKINSLDPQSPAYDPSDILAGATRIAGNVGTPGITAIRQSPMYFNITD